MQIQTMPATPYTATLKVISRLVFLLLAAALSACGYNVKAIKTFESSASSLTASYATIVSDTEKWCRDSHLYYGLTSPSYNGQKWLVDEVEKECGGYEKSNKAALISNSIVNGYAQALVTVIGVSPQYLNDDLSKMGTVVTDLKKGNGKPLMNDDVVKNTISMAQKLSEIYVTYKVKKETVHVIQQYKNLVNTHIRIMIAYAEDNYRAELKFSESASNRMEVDLGKVAVQASTIHKAPVYLYAPEKPQPDSTRLIDVMTAPSPEEIVPHRYLLNQLYVARVETQKRDTAIKKLKEAGEALIIANNELEKKFKELDSDEQLPSVIDFAKKAQSLRDSLIKVSE